LGGSCDPLARPVVVPECAVWKIDLGVDRGVVLDMLKVWSCSLWNYKERLSKHELLIKRESHRVLGELVPHGSDDWNSS